MMTTKLSPTQQRVIDAMSMGVSVTPVFWMDMPDDVIWVQRRTVVALLNRGLIRRAADSREGARPRYVLTDAGAAAATRHEPTEPETSVSNLDADGEQVSSDEPTGYMRPCGRCGGSGTVPNGDYVKHCPDCDGTGIYTPDADDAAHIEQGGYERVWPGHNGVSNLTTDTTN